MTILASLHILAALVWVGGMFFRLHCATPFHRTTPACGAVGALASRAPSLLPVGVGEHRSSSALLSGDGGRHFDDDDEPTPPGMEMVR
jgi:hypothetical protein